MIGKISTPRGEHVEPLLYYLFGPGRHEEHADPYIVAKLQAETHRILVTPDVKEKLAGQGADPMGTTPAETVEVSEAREFVLESAEVTGRL